MDNEALDDEHAADVFQMAEYLDQLKSTNESKLAQLGKKEKDYDALDAKLASVVSKTRHPHMAPVCNGLAYFETEMVHTNEVLVLLGENWFAERTTAQAREIVARRKAFLRTERTVLEAEQKNIASKMNLLTQTKEEEDQLRGAPTTADPTAAAVFGESGADAEATVEEDDLTLEEITQLEMELDAAGGDLSDEAIDAAIRSKIEEKKRRRLAAVAAVAPKPASPERDQQSGQPMFRSPADIFQKSSTTTGGSHGNSVPIEVVRQQGDFANPKKVSFATSGSDSRPKTAPSLAAVSVPGVMGTDVLLPRSVQKDIVAKDVVQERDPSAVSSARPLQGSAVDAQPKRKSKFRMEEM